MSKDASLTDGKMVAVVTGAARGIGLASARRLLELGYRVVMTDLDETEVRRQCALFTTRGLSAWSFGLDVLDEQRAVHVAALVEETIGPVGALVTSAGITNSSAACKMPLSSFRRIMDVNVAGTFMSCQAFGKCMLERGRGAIVTVSSVSGLGGQSGRANYVASKWAVIGLTKALAIEWGNRGVRVNSVAPGSVNTSLYAKVPAEFKEVITQRTPLKRAAEPEEISAAVVFLVSDDASYVNGAVIAVDGGISAGFLTHRSGSDLALP